MAQQTLDNSDALSEQRGKINNNALDAVSQSDTSDQALASNVALAAGKVLALESSVSTRTFSQNLNNASGLCGQLGTASTNRNVLLRLGANTSNFIIENYDSTLALLSVGPTGIVTGTSTTPTDISTGAVDGMNIRNNGTIGISKSFTTNAAVMGFYNPNGSVGSISINGSATSYNTSSDPGLKIEDVSLLGDNIVEAQFEIVEDCTYGFWWKNKQGEKDEDQGPQIGFNAKKACELAPLTGLGTERASGTWDYELGEVYKTETVPAIEEEKDEKGNVIVEAVAEQIIEHKETPASIDNGKPMPVVIKMVSILRKKVAAQDELIASLVARLEALEA